MLVHLIYLAIGVAVGFVACLLALFAGAVSVAYRRPGAPPRMP